MRVISIETCTVYLIVMQNMIATERLYLTILTEDDHEFILKLVNSKGWIEFIGDRNIHTKESSIAYIKRLNDTIDLTYWIVRIKETDTPIGIVTFIKRSYLEYFDIGFAFLPEYNGKGYAYEASKKILSLVTAHPQHTKVVATTLPHNVRSINLLKKLGLQFDKEIEVGNEKLHLYSNAIKS